MASTPPLILLTGATGYVGGRLLHALEAEGARVRCLARHAAVLQARVGPRTEVAQADLLQPETLEAPLRGVDTAYYLAHAMAAGRAFAAADSQAARNFAEAARRAGIRRIIYLGGLGRAEEGLSEHLRSRQEVGAILRRSGAEVVELRASIIIGSGSLSFEMLRALVERLPVMLTPRWVHRESQPIAVEDVIAYLVHARTHPPGGGVVEIGGPDRVAYVELMHEYARQRGLRRLMLPVPVLSPRLSALWLGLVTPVFARVGRSLVESLRNDTVVTDPGPARAFPVVPMGMRAAMARALSNEERAFTESRWSDAVSSTAQQQKASIAHFGNRLVDAREIHVSVPAELAFLPIRRIGGKQGWYSANLLWHLRGWMDLLAGGVGMRRGRADPEHLRVGDAVDCWRVEALEPGRRLRLAAEMRLPGRAWLEFEVSPATEGSTIRQVAIFDPRGLGGLLYWYGVCPLHQWVFRGMLRGIAHAAEQAAGAAKAA